MEAATSVSSVYRPSEAKSQVFQGEIFSDLPQVRIHLEYINPKLNDVKVRRLIHPWSIVVTQDCDLESDFRTRSKGTTVTQLTNVLFCQLLLASDVFKANYNNPNQTANDWVRTEQNKTERYHYFQRAELVEDAKGEGLPTLIADFKKYFTIPTDELYAYIDQQITIRRCILNSPYLEHFSSRFHNFQSRVALPIDHKREDFKHLVVQSVETTNQSKL